MRDREYQLILDSCRQLADTNSSIELEHPDLAENNATDIKGEIEGFLGAVFRDREQIEQEAVNSMQPLLTVFDIGLLQACDLAHFAWKNHDTNTRLIWDEANLPDRPHPNRVFYLLNSNLAQSLQAIRTLLLLGFEGQSRAMVRAFIELADVALAIVADKEVYKHYITVYEDSKKDLAHWRKHLAPGVIRRRLERLDEELGLKEMTSIPASEVRKDTYEWFSAFSHVNMVAHLVSAYPQQLLTERMGPIAMLGEVGEMTKATFSRILLYLWLFFIHFDRLLWERHRWDRFEGENTREWYRYRSNVFHLLFRENYSILQGIDEGEMEDSA